MRIDTISPSQEAIMAMLQEGVYPPLTDALCQEIVRRILAVGQPLKIVLFGSRARGNYKPNSDIDILILERDDNKVQEGKWRYHTALHHLYPEFTIIVESVRSVELWRHVPSHLLTSALSYGRCLYQDERALVYEIESARNLLVAEAEDYKSSQDLAQDWLLLADRELRLSRVSLTQLGDSEYACFHVQQAIEKYLKIVLILHGQPDMKTHDLRELLEACKKFAPLPEVQQISLEKLKRLSTFAVEPRYNPLFRASKEEVEDAMNIAWNIREAVTALLLKDE